MKVTKRNTEKTRKRVQLHRGVNAIMAEQSEQISRQLDNIRRLRNSIQAIDCERSDEPVRLSAQEQINDSSMIDIQINQLRSWVLEFHISHRAVNQLQKLLISFGLNWLPKDSRTLMQTPKLVNISDMGNGKFWYDGLSNNLKRISSNLKEYSNISLNINIDGLPLFDSSRIQMWPILISINGENVLKLSFERICLLFSFCRITKFTATGHRNLVWRR